MTAAPAFLLWVPLLHPLPLWDYWYLLLLPLCVGVSVVYKAIRCRSMADVPREALQTTLWILAAMVAAAVILLIIVKLAAWWHS